MSANLAAALAYDIVRYLGVAYLVYLAYRILRTPGEAMTVGRLHRDSLGRIYRQSIVTNIVNPKSALFYLSFVPQFVDPARGSAFAQFILLGLIFNVGGNIVNLLVALFFGRIGDWLSRHPRVWHTSAGSPPRCWAGSRCTWRSSPGVEGAARRRFGCPN